MDKTTLLCLVAGLVHKVSNGQPDADDAALAVGRAELIIKDVERREEKRLLGAYHKDKR